MLGALSARSGTGGLLLAVMMAVGLFLHSAMAARIAPVGHAPHHLASSAMRGGSGHHQHHHGDSDISALMKSCAGYCGLVGVRNDGLALPAQLGKSLGVANEVAPAPTDHRPGVPLPRAILA